MSIFNALLTGGILIGKVCQALSPGAAVKYVHTESGETIFGEVNAAGVKFYRKESEGKSTIWAFNTSTSSSASITVPNSGSDSGLTYMIPPTQTIAFAEAESQAVSPSTNIIVGLTNDGAPTGDRLGMPNPLFRLAFSGLKVGNIVNIGSFKLSCTTTQLVVVSTQITATAMTYMHFNSDKGVSITNQSRIVPEDKVSLGEGGEVRFTIGFNELGINPTVDTISGEATFEVSNSTKALLAQSAVLARPLNEAERAYFSNVL